MGTNINIKKKIAVQEESVTITADVNSLNFTGAGVTASTVGDDVTINIPGAAGSTTYYLNQTVTQAPYKEFSSIPTGAIEQTISAPVAAGSTITIQSFQTASGVPGTTNIPAGLWSFYLHFSGTATDTWDIYVEVYKRDLGGIETLLLTTDVIPISTLSGTPTMILTDGVFPASTVLTTDRIVVKVKVTNTDSTTNTITFHTEGSTNYSVGLTTLNQIVPTGAVTSVTGTAPVVSSGGTTPAISMAQANGSTNGYLSSTDWNTFNGKQDPITLTTTGTTGAATFIANVLNVPQYQGSLTLTTTGSSGASTLVGNTLNIPDYTLSGLGGVPSSRTLTINGTAQDLSADRTWSVGTVTSVGLTAGTGISLAGTNPITGSGSITVTNSAPDQTVVLTPGSGIGITGSYPNFTISNTATAASGVWGISNGSGVYTYYATLTLAMAAAVSGNTIELFADVSDTDTSVALKDGVNINLNGHTYTWTSTVGTLSALTVPATGTCEILNGKMYGTGLSGDNILMINQPFTVITNVYYETVRCGVQIENGGRLVGGVYYAGLGNCILMQSAAIIENVDCTATQNPIYVSAGVIYNSIGRSIATGAAGVRYGIQLVSSAQAYNCTGVVFSSSSGSAGIHVTSSNANNSSGYSSSALGIYGLNAVLNNCSGRSDGGNGIEVTTSTLNGCVGYSTSSSGIYDTNCIVSNSKGHSTAGNGYTSLFNNTTYRNKTNVSGYSAAIDGMYLGGRVHAQGCSGYSTVQNGLQVGDQEAAFPVTYGNPILNSCSGMSSAGPGISIGKQSNTSTISILNCTATSTWNSIGGHAISSIGSATSGTIIANTTCTVANSGAYAINVAAAETIKYISNIFIGSTTPLDPLITQAVINTQDNQGNILV